MFVAEPVLLDTAANASPMLVARAERPTAHQAASPVLHSLSSARQLLAWHRSQRPTLGHKQVSARAWRRQSALICLQADLEIEARR
jgi:hypothetical protein